MNGSIINVLKDNLGDIKSVVMTSTVIFRHEKIKLEGSNSTELSVTLEISGFNSV